MQGPSPALVLRQQAQDLPPGVAPGTPWDPVMGFMTDQFVNDLTIARAFGFAGLTLVAYDYLLTLGTEIRYVWRARRSLVNTLFLVSRYGGLAVVAGAALQLGGVWTDDALPFCFFASLWLSVFIWCITASINTVILLRVWVLWGRSRAVLIGLITAFLAYSAACIGIIIWGTIIGGYDGFVFRRSIGTCQSGVPPWTWLVWLPGIIFDSVAFVLTLLTTREYRYRRFGVSTYSPMMQTVYRDAIIFYLTSVLSNLFNIYTWVKYPLRPLNNMSYILGFAVVIVVGQRLVLGLREHDVSRTTNTTRVQAEIVRHVNALDVDAHLAQIIEIRAPGRTDADWEDAVETAWARRLGDFGPIPLREMAVEGSEADSSADGLGTSRGIERTPSKDTGSDTLEVGMY